MGRWLRQHSVVQDRAVQIDLVQAVVQTALAQTVEERPFQGRVSHFEIVGL